MDITLIFLLILINGVFAMSEMAVVSSRKARLQNLADNGKPGAQTALGLQDEPSSFLSTIQVGITSVGILSGAIGETAIADPLGAWLAHIPYFEPYAKVTALAITIVGLTYFSVVVGELLPKRLALLAPEQIASLVSRPMVVLARISHPLVVVLSGSCAVLLRIFGANQKDEPPVTDDEIKVLMEQGAEAGVFHESEQAIVSNVLRLDNQSIAAIMTPRHEMCVLDLNDGAAELRHTIAHAAYARLVVCRDGLEHVLGILQTGDLLKQTLAGHEISAQDIEAVLHPPLYIPESISTTQALENFRRSRLQFALVVDEYGDVQGVVTMTDVLISIVGEVALPAAPEDQDIVRREDGSWLVNGDTSIERVKTAFAISDELPGEGTRNFHTLGGFVMFALGRIPAPTDHIETAGFRIEVMDMDRNRVDKVLVMRLDAPAVPDQA